MLERVSLHQTRLRTPGISLDARGIAMGAKGLVLFPSLDRLVAFLAVYTETQTLDDLMGSLTIERVRSELGAQEVVFQVRAESSDRLDRLSEVARLTGGHIFTGTGRHWVQYRDASAPFGYDVSELSTVSASYVLYHEAYTQAYEPEKGIELRDLVLRMSPYLEVQEGKEPGQRWLLAEWGLGGAVTHYLRRSGVQAQVCVVEWPSSSDLEDGPERRYLFQIPEFMERMVGLFSNTPGMQLYVPAAVGAAVEIGYRHPLQLRAIPAFRGEGLVLFRGRGENPLVIEKLPQMGSLHSLARMELNHKIVSVKGQGTPSPMRVALRLVPTLSPWTRVTATWVHQENLGMLRRLLYALGPATLRKASMAVTENGVLLRVQSGVDSLPIGEFYREFATNIYLPAGYEPSPAVSPQVLAESLEIPMNSVVFMRVNDAAWVVPEECFVPLEAAILEGQAWTNLRSQDLEAQLMEPLAEIELRVESLGLNPLNQVKALPAPEEG
jgi:hypothetical protein